MNQGWIVDPLSTRALHQAIRTYRNACARLPVFVCLSTYPHEESGCRTSRRLTIPMTLPSFVTGSLLTCPCSIIRTIIDNGVSSAMQSVSRVMTEPTVRAWVRTYSCAKDQGPNSSFFQGALG